MTGQRWPRQTVSRPATMMAAAPANRAMRQGTPSSIVWTEESPVTTAPAGEPEDAPPVVEPEPPEATEDEVLTLDEAAAMTRAALSEPLAAMTAPTPHRARIAPATRRSRPRVAMIAARQARPASANAPAPG